MRGDCRGRLIAFVARDFRVPGSVGALFIYFSTIFIFLFLFLLRDFPHFPRDFSRNSSRIFLPEDLRKGTHV